jgi:endoribonuclease LACTB2
MSKLRPAATLVLVRKSSGRTANVEVAWVHRLAGLRFLGDFWAFPGGACEKDEAQDAACVRETLEEVGLQVGVEDLVPCARWITPPFGPLRFDTQFFLRVLKPGEPSDLRVGEGELDQAEWIEPRRALARWAEDDALLAPPTRRTLEALASIIDSGGDDPCAPGWLEAAALAIQASAPPDGEPDLAIDFRPGLRVFPVRTPTLPPATHTNCYIVGHGRDLIVIDPASPWEEEQERLDRVIDDLIAQGHRVREVVLTHHHPDHSGGAEALARRLGVPIAAHATTRALLQGRVSVDRLIADGEVFDLPGDRPGARPRRLRAHVLEGHADGHLAFHEEVTNGVIAGDMVAGTGTIIVDPPEGKMALYIDSLRRLRALGARVLYPAHGPPIGDPAKFVDEYISHRLGREAKVLAAVAAGAATVEELVPRAYTDVKPELYPFAARSLLAHLQKLEQEGHVKVRDDVWQLA